MTDLLKKIINFIRTILSRIWGIPVRIFTFKNWWVWLEERLNILSKHKKGNEQIAQLRNGVKFYFKLKWGEFGPIYEIWCQKIYTKYYQIKNEDVVIDIGANIGAFSIFAAKAAKGVKVFSYEPNSKTFERLFKNIKINNLENFIFPFQIGIAGYGGERKLFINQNSSLDSALYKNYSSISKNNFLFVKTITLEDVFKNNNLDCCDFLKIDAEGAEYEILFNTPIEYLKKIRNIGLEYHQRHEKIIDFLKQINFQVYYEPYINSKMSGRIWAQSN